MSRKRSFNSPINNEIETANGHIQIALDDMEPNLCQNLWRTETLAYCFMEGIHELILGANNCLRCRSLLAARALMRSVVEYTVDMALVILENDTILNRKFELHFLVRAYPDRHKSDLDDELRKWIRTKLEADYDSFVQGQAEQVYESEFNKAKAKSVKSNGNFKDILSNQLKKYRNSWTGMGLEKRVQFIVARAILGKDSVDPGADWKSAEGRLKRQHGSLWNDYRESHRWNLLEGALRDMRPETAEDHPILDALAGLVGQVAAFLWGAYSGSVHPSSYGLLPHMENITGKIHRLAHHHDDETLQDTSKCLMLLLETAAQCFLLVLKGTDHDRFKESVIEFITAECPTYLEYITGNVRE